MNLRVKATNKRGSETPSTHGRWDRTLIIVQCFLVGNTTGKQNP